jgi:Sulfotransferase family
MPGTLTSAVLQLRAARRAARNGGGIGLRERLAPPDERVVFVLGCPRSGTTFLGRSLGSLDGFVDLGEVQPLKAAIPELAGAEPAVAAPRVRAILDRTRRLGLVGARRAVEQTPETVFVAEAAALAFPQGRLVHLVRDGRDVVCSLLERGWLSAGRAGYDDAGQGYGADARFWVEPERVGEFAGANDARRAAWAWRRYVESGLALAERAVEVRYEALSRDPEGVAATLAEALDVPEEPLAGALRGAHGDSIGRYARDLTAEQLADVEAGAGPLLERLGYR